MLRQLSLRDFVLVQELEIDFQQGFTVLTGETGAGKSILIDALQLVLGARGDANVVREGQDKTEICAVFDVPDVPEFQAWLQESGFEHEEPVLILRRMIDQQGKSRAWINGRPATISQLREPASFLVDIYGQLAWQGLTRPAHARELLDAYAKISNSSLLPLWKEWQYHQQRLDETKQRVAELQNEHDRLTWQINEIDKLGPQKDEWEEISIEHERLSHAQLLIDAAQAAYSELGENQPNIKDQLGHAIVKLEKAASIDQGLAGVLQVLQDAQTLVDDAHHSLSHWLRHSDLDPERLEELDTRMSNWLSLARRYRRKPEELYSLLQEWKQARQTLENESDLDALEKAAEQSFAAWLKVAQEISKKRKQAAPELAKAITQAMQQLGMKGGHFEIKVNAEDPGPNGIDYIEFLVAGHAGTTAKPVSKVASGGELSRIALAISVTTSQLGYIPTLVFDEVDSGVGGAVAQTIGQLMQQLGCERQVLAVTHLAQVASYAHQHMVVQKMTASMGDSKPTSKPITYSQVFEVQGQARVAEISRMLGGEESSATSLAHAQEMLKTAHD